LGLAPFVYVKKINTHYTWQKCYFNVYNMFNVFLVFSIWLPVFFLFSMMNQNWVQESILALALTPLPSSIGRESNPRPSNREPSALPLDHSFCYAYNIVT